MKTFRFAITLLSLLLSYPAFSQELLPKLKSMMSVDNQKLILDSYQETHILSSSSPIQNGAIVLNSEDAFLVFDSIRPSEVVKHWLKYINIQGDSAQINVNCRVCVYKHGTALQAHTPSIQPLSVFTEKSFHGDSCKLELNTYYNNLDATFENRISSFRLKRGYSMVMANNADGTGYSRFFVADKGDLIVDLLPGLLNNKVSFIRVFPWEWPSKKGWCDVHGTAKGDKMNATWYYSWGIGQKTIPNQQYVPGKEQKYWPSFTSIQNLKEFSHLYTYTEPDNKIAPDRMMTPDEVIAAWPELLKTGMRIGAPAFMYENNIFEFIKKADSLGYRVDFVVAHCYWGGKSAVQWYNDLKKIHEKTGRPLWIKEWNTGGNWTHETWPTLLKDQLNSQYNQIKGILQVMDTAHFVERYSIYNWVEEKRSMILDIPDSTYQNNIDKQQARIDTTQDATLKDQLVIKLDNYKNLFSQVKDYRDVYGEITPAGSYYSNNKPDFAFSRDREVIPFFIEERPTLKSKATTRDLFELTWTNRNGEVSDSVILEKKNIDGYYEPVTVFENKFSGSYVGSYTSVNLPAYYRIRTVTEELPSAFSDEVCLQSFLQENQTSLGILSLKNNVSAILRFEPAFEKTPLVLLGTPSYNNGYSLPLTQRVYTALSHTVNIGLEKWQYVQNKVMVQPERLPFLAINAGPIDWGGIRGEAYTVTNVKDSWKKVSFMTPFDTVPAVFVSRISSLSDIPTNLRIRNITPIGFEICQQQEMKGSQYIIPDKIAYVALMPGEGMIHGNKVEVGFTPPASVGGITPYAMKLKQNYQTPLSFSCVQSDNDSTVFTTRLKASTSNTLFLINSRELSASTNRVLNKEQVAYLVIDASKNVNSLSSMKISCRIYPTIVHDYLIIEGLSKPEMAHLYDLSGTLVKKSMVSNQVDMSDLKQGFYFIKIASGIYHFIKE